MDKIEAIGGLSALGHPTRLGAFQLMVAGGRGGVSAGVLADYLDVPAQTLSFHLKELVGSGLVTARRDGRSIFYCADFTSMVGLVDYLIENCCSTTRE